MGLENLNTSEVKLLDWKEGTVVSKPDDQKSSSRSWNIQDMFPEGVPETEVFSGR